MSLSMLVTAVAIALTPAHASAPPTAEATARERAEVARIQAHFDGALEMLDSRDVSGLSPAQRERRAGLAAELRRYRDRAAFPRNYDFPGEAMPYFIDRKTGIRCAVAHLMEHTGAHALVERVAAADNNVWVEELAGDAEVAAWLSANGLTLAEAARIQVPYIDGEPQSVALPDPRPAASAWLPSMAMGTALASSAINTFVYSATPTRTGVVLGALSGAFAITSGATARNGRGASEIGTASVVAGTVGLFVAGRAFHRLRQQQRAADAAAPGATEGGQARARIAPIIPLSGTQGFGASFSLTF